ncbi:putative acyl-activating enzyme 16, chloroplastic isoform X1 [Gossypium australe]|uniref:Putative acyl-activating enzyme 16, chloroplastic isoform X1 n=1 Tax=Gossypium australe TaxID=47621 RepID=A0A5B6WFZ3_9ROSI|nr:putative acyl-activating enzyme 16, chloroplastic isoform X1 [Gossypium australe]
MTIIQLYRVFNSTYLVGKAFDSKCSLNYFIFGSPCSGIQKQISTSSTIRKLIAVSFIKVSLAYMEFKRIYEGLYLTRNTEQPSYLASMLDCLWARIIAAILWPLHVLAKKLVYQKIRSAIGISKAGINGGGNLPMHLDKFFEAIGVTVQNGYGLTESSPVVACRRPYCNVSNVKKFSKRISSCTLATDFAKPIALSKKRVIGSIGHPIQHTEFKVVDSETGEVLPPGTRGIVKVRGPQVMKGYYKNPLATKQALDEDGWLDTGDIGWIAPHHSAGRSRRCGGVIVLEGRAKDTIVLSSGENVEPLEIEEAAMRSSLIQQIVVDQRRLAAIIVPNKDEVLQAAKVSTIVDPDAVDLGRDKMTSLLYEELSKWTSECSFQVGPILVVDEPFTIDSGLMTPTMKIRRDQVVAKYKEEIANLYK